MKKRKPPILLGAILLILVGVVLAVNASSLPSTEPPEKVAKAEEPAAPEPEAEVDEDDKVHQPVFSPKRAKPKKGEIQTTVKSIPALDKGQPLIAAPRQLGTKGPKASVSANGQWYRPESGAGKG